MALTDNIVSYWKFQGNSTDELGANTGTDTAMTYGDAYGKIGNGALFNGTSSVITKTSATLQTGSGNWSISMWFKQSANDDVPFVFKTPSSTTAGTWIGCYYGNGAFGLAGVNPDTYWSGYTYDSNWHHAVFVHNAGNLKIYLDNDEKKSSSITMNLAASGQTMTIGSAGDWYSNYWSNYLDEVGLWSRNLTAAEVTELYNGGSGYQYPFSVLKSINGLAKASVKSKNNLAIASVKSFNGLA